MTYLDATAQRIRQALPPAAIPAQDGEVLLLLYALLAHVKGQRTTARDVHDAWTAWRRIRGSVHPAMVPYADLPPKVRVTDREFAVAIRRAAAKGQ